jgi:hypothetical protein
MPRQTAAAAALTCAATCWAVASLYSTTSEWRGSCWGEEGMVRAVVMSKGGGPASIRMYVAGGGVLSGGRVAVEPAQDE